jgi:hypothetical protein
MPKTKRGTAVTIFDDTFIGPPPPAPFATISPHQPLHSDVPASRTFLKKFKSNSPRFTNVFGFDDISYQHIYNELNGDFNYGFPVSTQPIPPIPGSIPSQSQGFGFYNFGYGAYDFETYVSEDGRIVKQYSVHERHHNDHPEPMSFKPSVSVNMRAVPIQFQKVYITNRNLAQPRNFNPKPVPSFLSHNHGPIALGSGGLGFIRLPNGQIHLGSGSLGYISHKEHYDSTLESQNRKQRPHNGDSLTFRHHI